jgi:hypothetical protein
MIVITLRRFSFDRSHSLDAPDICSAPAMVKCKKFFVKLQEFYNVPDRVKIPGKQYFGTSGAVMYDAFQKVSIVEGRQLIIMKETDFKNS